MSLERWDAASKALADVLALDCNNVKATERQVKVLANQGKFAQAQALFDSAKSRGMIVNQVWVCVCVCMCVYVCVCVCV
jgi:hypothetical protein